MAFTAPRTWTVGEIITKAIMDTHIRDNQLYLKAETDLYDAHDAANAQAAHGTLGAHGIGDHTDVTRTLFISAMGCYTDGAVTGLGNIYVINLVDAAEKYIWVNWMCPNDFVSISSFGVVWSSPAGGGVVRLQFAAHYGASGEVYNTHSDDAGEAGHGAGNVNFIHVTTKAGLYATLAKGDYCGLYFRRHGDDANDTLGDIMQVLGFRLIYTAEQ